jgi:urease accessory protein
MDEGAELRSGLAHPLTGPDHFLAMFAVGLWGAQLGGAKVWELPLTFPLVMVIGGILGILGLPFSQVELSIAVSVLVLGTAISVAWRPSAWVALGLVSFFAIAHGYAHGMELPRAANHTDFVIGFVAATGLIHVLGIGAGFALQKPLNGRPIRYLGAMIALSGAYFLIA